jgi:hypothetical protein
MPSCSRLCSVGCLVPNILGTVTTAEGRALYFRPLETSAKYPKLFDSSLVYNEDRELVGQLLINASSLSEVFRQMKLDCGGSLSPEHFR